MAGGHFHLLLRTGPSASADASRCRAGPTPLSKVMRRLMTGYAVTFNKRHTCPPSAAPVRLFLLGRRAGFRRWQAGTQRPSLPEPIQIRRLRRRSVSSGTYSLHPPQPLTGKIGKGSQGTGQIPLDRPQRHPRPPQKSPDSRSRKYEVRNQESENTKPTRSTK